MHRAASLSCPLSGAGEPTCPPDRPSKILLVQVWTLSSSPIPRLGCLFSFFLSTSHFNTSFLLNNKAVNSPAAKKSLRHRRALALWAGAGAPEGVHAGGRWGPMARRRRRFFRDVFLFWPFFTCFHGNSAYLRPCYHALRQPVGAADRAMLHN